MSHQDRTPPPTLRDCRPHDYAVIAEIYSHWIRVGGATMDTRAKTANDIERMVDDFNPRECILVLEEDQEIAGWGIIKRYSDRPGYRVCCETSVYLRPSVERRGLGSLLKKALIERCRSLGYHHLVAKIWADNHASIAYNQKLGYQVVGIQRAIGHCRGEWRDICLMQLVLDDVPAYRPELGWPEATE